MPRLEEIPPEVVADAVAKAVVDAVGRGGSTETIVAIALDRVKRDLGLKPRGTDGVAAGPAAASPHPTPAPPTPRPTIASAPSHQAGSGFLPAPMGSGKSSGPRNDGGRALVTEADVLDAARNGHRELRLSPGTLVTALARDAARDAGMRLVEG